MRFIHTADWQIGKVFRRFGDKEALFREARLDAIEAIGREALSKGAAHVLVAGDVYDSEAPLGVTLRAPVERMRKFSTVTWHLLPGNHDPHRPRGLWDQLAGSDLPGNIRPHLEARPVEIEPGAWLLPAPLTRKSEPNDLTTWMDGAATPDGASRIGLAHGAVAGFSGDGEAANPVDPARPARAGLAYLALGDWHRTLKVGERCWYSGTPEPDRMGSQETGTALLVDVAGNAPPRVTPLLVGSYRWRSQARSLRDDAEIEDLDREIRQMEGLTRLVLRLQLTGQVSMAGRARIDAVLAGLEAAVCTLEPDLAGIRIRPGPEDLEAIDFDGALRQAAQRLQGRLKAPGLAPEEERVVEAALVKLHLLAEGARG
jgi:DNA repair exonuclease SbcCD nuclease subunit